MRFEKYKDFIKNTDEPIAFVLGIGGTGLGVIRSLGRRGIPVIGLDPNPRQIGLFSRYCVGIVCPDPEKKEREYIDFLLSLGEQLNTKGVLIPTADVDVLTISKHRDKLEKYYAFPMAKLEIIEKLVNKKEFYKTLEKLDMPHPKTYFPNDISEVKQISKEITYPYIIKPVFSHEFSKKFSGAKVFKVNSEEELIKAYDRAKSGGHEVVVQEVIPGSDTNMYLVGAYFNHASEPLGIFTFRRIRQYPHVFGNGALCVSVWIPEIAELCTSFLKKIKYHGIIDAELKRDPRDNKFKYIEINSRTGWQNRLAARCGIDLPYIAYMDAIGGNVEKVVSQKVGVKWLYMFDDLRSSFESMSKGELSFIEWINSLRGEKEYAIFAWDDPLPFFVSLFNLSSAVLRYSLRHSISYVKSVLKR
jgi:predicted ATP-grasp superfamily ATP-dependent carboligase